MIERKLIHFNNEEIFNSKKNEIDNTSIAFVGDGVDNSKGKFIYTHGEKYMTDGSGNGSNVTVTPITTAQGNTKIATITVDGNANDIYAPTSGGSNYTAGNGISISNGEISVKEASANELGGIKVGYPDSASNRNYGVRIDNSTKKAYVNVPWAAEIGDGSGKYYEQAFRTTARDVSLTANDVPDGNWPNGTDGWKRYAENVDGNSLVWMCTRLTSIEGSALENWQGPWLISGPEGIGGDSADIEFIYYNNDSSDRSDLPSVNNLNGTVRNSPITLTSEEYKTQDDFVPANWSDNAIGVSSSLKFEWVSIRTKVGGQWSAFGTPIIWSHWGKNGMDGDGVEYIFAPKVENQAIVSDPSTWTSDANFQSSEYIRQNASSEWFDNPQDLTSSSFGPGSIQYVSIRKKYAESGSTEATWHAYSTPVMWNMHPKDGVASGYSVDLSNPMMPVPLAPDGTTAGYNNNTIVYAYKNGVTQSAVLSGSTLSNNLYYITLGPITRSDSVAVGNSIQAAIGADNKTVTVTIAANTNLENVNAYIPITVTLDNNESRLQVLTIYGVRAGADANFIDLYTSAAAIRLNYQRTIVYPTALTVGMRYNSDSIEYVGSITHSGFTFEYYYDTDVVHSQQVTGNIQLTPGHDSITVVMKYNNVVYDYDVIPYVTDGAPGIKGAEAVNYNISVISSTITVDGNNVAGSARFNITKYHDGLVDTLTGYSVGVGSIWTKDENTPEYNQNSPTYTDEELLSAQICGQTASLNYDSSNHYWTITVPNNATYDASTSTAFIQMTTNTGKSLAAVIIPFSIKGAQGNSPVQALTGVVMRFNSSYNSSTEYYDGTTAVNGIKYLDVLLSNNNYYKPVENALAGGYVQGIDPATPGQTSWTMFQPMSDSYINTLIANTIGATDITAKQVVITKTEQNVTSVVAGMVSGSEIPSELGNSVTNANGIRIFAGNVPSNGDLNSTAFNVDNDGKVVAASGKVVLYANGSGSIANGNITWDANGNVTLVNSDVSNLLLTTNNTSLHRNAYIITEIVKYSTVNTLHFYGILIKDFMVYSIFLSYVDVPSLSIFLKDLFNLLSFGPSNGKLLLSQIYPEGSKISILNTTHAVHVLDSTTNAVSYDPHSNYNINPLVDYVFTMPANYYQPSNA